MRPLPTLCALGCALAVPSAALGAGGPVPPIQGGAGVHVRGGGSSFVARKAGRSTLVERVRRSDHKLVATLRIPGHFGVPGAAFDGSRTGLSADGRTLVLAQTVRNFPKRTRLLVLDTSPLRVRDRLALDGYFAVDAVSPDGRWMYFIHSKSTFDPNAYDVRAFDVAARRLLAHPIVDPRDVEKMQGVPMARAMSPDGRWAYTLYIRPDDAPFVHALDTATQRARCIDLDSVGPIDMSSPRLLLGHHGATLRVLNHGTLLGTIDTRTFTAHEPKLPATAPPPPHRAAPPAHDDGGVPWTLAIGGVAAAAAAAALTRKRTTNVPRSPL